MRYFISLLFIFSSFLIKSQDDFISMHNRSFSSSHLGKSVIYGSNEIKFTDTLYQTIELKPSILRETNYNDLIEEINRHDNIIYLQIKKNLFSEKSKSKLEVLPFQKLINIRYFDLWGGRLNCDYEELFNELNLMPKLDYLILPKYQSGGIDTIKSFQKIITKVKGLLVKDNRVNFENTLSEVTELVLHQDNEILFSNLKKLESSKIRELNLSSDTITDDILELISGFTNLNHLQISAKQYKNSKNIVDYFKKYSQLKKLKIDKLNEREFSRLGELNGIQELNITLDAIQTKDISPVFDLTDLQNLTLYVYKSDELHWTRTGSKRLQHLEINGKIKLICEELGQLANLQSLDVSSNQLSSLPESIGDLRHLKKIDLRYNSINELPKSFTKLSSLEFLLADKNLLTTIPNSIGNLLNLVELDLSYNDISMIPKSIGKCRKLMTLDLSNNFIKSIPKELYKLSNLETLNLSSNQLTGLPNGISALSNLKKIYLGKWNISLDKNEDRIPRSQNDIIGTPDDLWKLNNIELINFSYNENIDEEIIETILKFENPRCDIRLRNCGIEKLPSKGWKDFKVKNLDLSHNVISSVPEEFFFSNIVEINLLHNSLGLMDAKFTSVTNLRLYGYLKGKVSKEELVNREDLISVIMDVAGRKYYSGQNPILDIYPLAFEIDSLKSTSLIDHENYADALFEVGEFRKCIPHYNMAINEDLDKCLRVVNFTLPKINNRHISYLQTNDTISAIDDLHYIQDLFGYNMASKISMLYYEQGDSVNHKKYIEEAILYYEGNQSPSLGDKLSLLELYLIAEYEEKFQELSYSLAENKINNKLYSVIYKYLTLVSKITRNEDQQIDDFLIELENSGYKNKRWNCELIQKWAKRIKLGQKIKIEELNNFICPN